MVNIQENFSLKQFNTFGIDAEARYFVRASSLDDLKEVLTGHRECFPFMVIGEGSNILFTRDYNGIIINPALKGVSIINDNLEHCIVEVGAGENWDEFVKWSVNNKLGGIENLSLIPGSTGSSPIQNIGAYGVEVKDVIQCVNYLDLQTLKVLSIPNHECNFGYRSSIFKTHLKNKVIITSVVFRLSHNPVFNTTYGNLQSEVEKSGNLSLKTLRNAVIKIRRSKLPDPEIIGNAGSFFKNPVIEASVAYQMKEEYEQLPLYPVSDNWTKIPAGWLIEKCGWKGKRIGAAGVHENQALVLVNLGNATGEEIYKLSLQICASVYEKFRISLEPEVNIV